MLAAFRVDPEFVQGPEYETGGDISGPVLYANEPYDPDGDYYDAHRLISPSGNVDFTGYYGWRGVEPGLTFIRYYYPTTPYSYAALQETDYYSFSPEYFAYFVIKEGRLAFYCWGQS